MTHSLRTNLKQWRHVLNSRNYSEGAVSLLLSPFQKVPRKFHVRRSDLKLVIPPSDSVESWASSFKLQGPDSIQPHYSGPGSYLCCLYYILLVGAHKVYMIFLTTSTLVVWILIRSVVNRDGETSKFDSRQVVTDLSQSIRVMSPAHRPSITFDLFPIFFDDP